MNEDRSLLDNTVRSANVPVSVIVCKYSELSGSLGRARISDEYFREKYGTVIDDDRLKTRVVTVTVPENKK